MLKWHPDRIGHVINVPEDVKAEIVKRKLGLELCLSCNVHAKMITGTYGDHHFGWWRETGCPIALSVCQPFCPDSQKYPSWNMMVEDRKEIRF
jgi:adenosine deaminase